MKARVLTALVLAPIVLGAFFLANPWPLFVLALVAAYIGGTEIGAMLGKPGPSYGLAACIIMLLPIPFLIASRETVDQIPRGLIFSVLGVTSTWLVVKHKLEWLMPAAVCWAVGPLLCLIFLSSQAGEATPFRASVPALMAIVPLWGGDTAAIFAGKAFGKHPLAPKISPKKTLEGAFANLIACILVAWGLGALMGFSTAISLACGVAAGTLGQAGDLFESYVKRQAGLKDSGTLLPGHGGLMDRIDSILFTAPAVAMIFWVASKFGS